MHTGRFRGFDVSIEDPDIACITFNEPDRMNGMTAPMKRDLIEIVTQAQMDEAIRVLVFTGSGRAFSAGDDITEHPRPTDRPGIVPDAPPAFSQAKNHALGTYEGLRTYSQALEDIASKTAMSDQQPDAQEGITAWREKRDPRFNRWMD